jgi:hypothetical protein
MGPRSAAGDRGAVHRIAVVLQSQTLGPVGVAADQPAADGTPNRTTGQATGTGAGQRFAPRPHADIRHAPPGARQDRPAGSCRRTEEPSTKVAAAPAHRAGRRDRPATNRPGPRSHPPGCRRAPGPPGDSPRPPRRHRHALPGARRDRPARGRSRGAVHQLAASHEALGCRKRRAWASRRGRRADRVHLWRETVPAARMAAPGPPRSNGCGPCSGRNARLNRQWLFRAAGQQRIGEAGTVFCATTAKRSPEPARCIAW